MKKWLRRSSDSKASLANKSARQDLINKIFKRLGENGVGITRSAGVTIAWSYETRPADVFIGIMNDGVTVLRISFSLKQLSAAKETGQGIMLTLSSPAEVSSTLGEHSYDTEWPLIINWGQEPWLKEEMLNDLTALALLNAAEDND